MERTYVWRRLWQACVSVVVSAVMWWTYYATDGGGWKLIFLIISFLITMFALSDIREFFSELDRRADLNRERRGR